MGGGRRRRRRRLQWVNKMPRPPPLPTCFCWAYGGSLWPDEDDFGDGELHYLIGAYLWPDASGFVRKLVDLDSICRQSVLMKKWQKEKSKKKLKKKKKLKN